MDAAVVWTSGMSFTGSADSGFAVALGAGAAVGGADDGFRPMELILTGLAGCTAMDVVSILARKRQKLTGFTVQAHAARADEHPKVFTAIHLHYVVQGEGLDPAAVQRAIELSATRYCPAQAMLAQVAPITTDFEVIEDAATV